MACSLIISFVVQQASTINDSEFGADVFAQRFMMMFVLKDVRVNIRLVDAIKSRNMKKLPALKLFENDPVEDPAEIEALIEKISPDHPLRSANDEVNHLVFKGAGSGVYHKFNQLAKNTDPNTDERLKANLIEELAALDTFLRSKKPQRFLGGENLCLPDCILLPKLLHIKVVAKVFKDFDIPEDFEGIHKYLDAASGKEGETPDINVEAFTRTSPSDEVIVDAWSRWMKVPNPLQRRKKPWWSSIFAETAVINVVLKELGIRSVLTIICVDFFRFLWASSFVNGIQKNSVCTRVLLRVWYLHQRISDLNSKRMQI